MTWAMVLLGAGVGAPLRFLVDRALSHRLGGRLPLGTLAVNLLGCTGLGAVSALTLPATLAAVLGPGLLATLSTYAALSWETVRLIETGRTPLALVSVVANVVGGTLALLAGAALAAAFAG
ncbi:CrcB protein [Streptomyces bohaiensis]|uniref:Fluoride-specific ion channel FluC n=1 Tax=Streptomyces bohaiensis TaxID=1431344 RepID=A0ABX1CGM8_9ACTN|nr:CrcB protein [Streptomyces bohaiensis]